MKFTKHYVWWFNIQVYYLFFTHHIENKEKFSYEPSITFIEFGFIHDWLSEYVSIDVLLD